MLSISQGTVKLKDQKGMTMILTLIVIFVFTILGVALWQYSSSNTLQVQKAYKQRQAYYIARSGIEALSSHILKSPNTVALKNSLDLVMNTTSSPISIGEGFCRVTMNRIDNVINLKAVGTIDGESAVAELEIKEKVTTGFPSPVFKNVIFSDDSIALNGTVDVIGGTLEATGGVKINGVTDPTSIENSVKNYPKIIYPSNLSLTVQNVPNGNTLLIDSNSLYKSITVEEDGILKFQLNGGDLKVVIDSLTVRGEVILNGTGRLLLYVKNLETLGNGEINLVNESQPITSFMVLMPDNGVFKVKRFRGLLYGPGSSITLLENGSFRGALVGGKVVNSHNTTIYYNDSAATLPSTFFDGINVLNTTTVEYSLGKWK